MTSFALLSKDAAHNATTPANDTPQNAYSIAIYHRMIGKEGQSIRVVLNLLDGVNVVARHAATETNGAWVLNERRDSRSLETLGDIGQVHHLFDCIELETNQSLRGLKRA